MSEFENERVRGLPGPLPSGERVLWRGAPVWSALAWRAFHVRDVLVWFALVAAVRACVEVAGGISLRAALAGEIWMVPVCGLAVAILCGLAILSARTTIYTLTDRRIVMRIGIALPLTVNLPHRQTGAAYLRMGRRGVGDLGVTLPDGTRLAWLVLWPHVRPWRMRQPEPMLRAVPDVARVADLLSGALAATAAGGFIRTGASEPAAGARGPALPEGVGAAT